MRLGLRSHWSYGLMFVAHGLLSLLISFSVGVGFEVDKKGRTEVLSLSDNGYVATLRHLATLETFLWDLLPATHTRFIAQAMKELSLTKVCWKNRRVIDSDLRRHG